MASTRQPCPGRIFDDIGGGFAMGCGAGVLLYFIKGFWNAPNKERLTQGFKHVANRAPVLGGNIIKEASQCGLDASLVLIVH